MTNQHHAKLWIGIHANHVNWKAIPYIPDNPTVQQVIDYVSNGETTPLNAIKYLHVNDLGDKILNTLILGQPLCQARPNACCVVESETFNKHLIRMQSIFETFLAKAKPKAITIHTTYPPPTYPLQIQHVLAHIELAHQANGGRYAHDQYCQCNCETGQIPCQYCAVNNALVSAQTIIETLSKTNTTPKDL